MKKTLLTLFAILTLAFSAKAELIEGTCGESLTWCLDTETETLTISGNGLMDNFAAGKSPWSDYSWFLAHVIIGDSVASIGDKAFYECAYIKSVHIGNSVTSIGEFAFAYCTRLHNVNISDSVITIKKCAFARCESLRDITIPKSVEEIQSKAFYETTKLESIVVDPENEVYDSRNNCNGIVITDSDQLFIVCKKTVIANTIKIITPHAFSGIDIESVSIPNSVNSIGESTFWNCSKLKHLTFGDSLESIGGSAFYSCEQIEELYIPSSVTSIGNQAFGSCSGLTSIVVDPDNKTYDSRGNCNAIICTETGELVRGCENTVLPNSISAIGVDAFSGCEGIQKVVIPGLVTTIKHYAYFGCRNLDSLVLPASLKTIESDAFGSCNLKTIYCYATTPPECLDGAFYSYILERCKLYVPFGCMQAYKEAETWKDFWNIIELPEGYGVSENQALSVSVFPNPTTDFVNINCENMTDIGIFTMEGKLANRIITQSDEIQIDMSMLPDGAYYFRIETKEGSITRKIIKK